MERERRAGASARPVVVIGAGASGVLSAAALLRARHATVLVERDASWSTGPAFATEDPQHLLNVPARMLSADTGHPGDFVEWAAARQPDVSAHSFLPRRLYGEYLRQSLESAAQAARPVAFSRVTAEAITVETACTKHHDRGSVRVELRGGRSLLASHVVLALGNPPSRALARDVDTVIEDPWSIGSSNRIRPDDSIVIVGSGLTAVDVTLTLAGRGHRGPIRLVSRHGLLPRTHAPRPQRVIAVPDWEPAPTARALLAWIRTAIVEAGGDWRGVLDAVRPSTNEIWRRLPDQERARLVRHLSRYWEVHRHRIGPEVGRAVSALVESGRVNLAVGTVTRIERGTHRGCRVVVLDARGAPSTLEARWVINCTGPNFDLRESASLLVRRLFDNGAARPGPLGHGLDVTPDGALIDRSGRVSAVVSVVGPMRRGADWETTAIPEIRMQADALAGRLVSARPATGPRVPPRSSRPSGASLDRRRTLAGTETVS